ncbi:hypothetical protein EWI31_22195 [Streptomyces tsukubensis]|uniref:Uncharacterized protein n=1 Tax=Streptomyces tsukubensis (strain DSM 42081 / NBRC 108919 / NRRL 18488 / 9993) TaxID=1114943 RepID=A0A7G3U6P9_STRT9|nr:hypothetical protein STSU_001455 [Streptomyces tsukubensis NRRL18488]TAI42303.1 hypothetical protein EWI31_22195 [Streptomyces tsukubensis]
MGGALSAAKGAGQGVCSPRARGWSQRHRGHYCVPGVLPAGAGMVPADLRTCGPADPAARLLCSPRARGWSTV